ncbi:MAG: NfeD family protein [Methylococcales bacterium]|nr:NfeD family protein [Methylococcales bacterium]
MTDIVIVFWYWWVLAVFLLGVEILAPGFFFLWLSLSGFVVGSLLLLVPMTSLELQLLIFAGLSIISILIWRRYGIQHRPTTDHPLLNQRGAQYIGRTFSLIEPIKNGRGKIKVDDSIWTVQGEDCPLGSTVEVTAVNGVLFQVKLVDKNL